MADQKMEEIAAETIAAEKEPTQKASDHEKKLRMENLQKALDHVEAQQLSGARSLTPKEIMLDLSDLKAAHPDWHLRWVNIKSPGVAERRRLDGFIRLPESEGGRELGGEVAVFVTTRKLHERREAEIKQMNKDRLNAHKAEVEKVAEAVARELRDNYGIKVDLNRILVNEQG